MYYEYNIIFDHNYIHIMIVDQIYILVCFAI